MDTHSPFDSPPSSSNPTVSNPIIISSSSTSTNTSLPLNHPTSSSTTTTINSNQFQSQPRNMLDDLLHERAAIEPIHRAVPHLWALLDTEISRLSNVASDIKTANTLSSLATGIVRSSPLSTNLSFPNLTTSATTTTTTTSSSASKRSPSPPSNRKRVKIPVPAEKFPEYNFVGRLLGPRGTTLKTLERDYGCKIMIRGKGSIRKDKEPDVRGKPGWEHVFNEPLHVVIEVSDTLDDATASKTLNRAKAAVQVLLVPVPEEQDGLKREQLRALAIMNGTYRGGPGRSHDQLVIPQTISNSQMIHPSHQAAAAAAAAVAATGFPMDNHNLFLGNSMAGATTTNAAASTPNLMAGFDHSLDDTSIYQSIHLSRPIDLFETKSFQLQHQHSGSSHHGTGYSPSSGDTSPQNNLFENATNNTSNGGISVLTSKLQRCSVDDFATSSVGDDSPESSHTSEDGEPSSHVAPGTYPGGKVKVASLSPSNNRTETSLGVGGFIGQEFYNGAFSNGPSPNSWDQASPSLPFPSRLYNDHPIPSPQVLTSTTSTVSSINRHTGY